MIAGIELGERNLEITEELRIQREGERQDPEFMINTHQFSEKLIRLSNQLDKQVKLVSIGKFMKSLKRLTN